MKGKCKRRNDELLCANVHQIDQKNLHLLFSFERGKRVNLPKYQINANFIPIPIITIAILIIIKLMFSNKNTAEDEGFWLGKDGRRV